MNAPAEARDVDVDVVVVGAGFAGMYMLHKLRSLGFTSRVIEMGDDGHAGAFCQIAEHRAQHGQGRMGAASRPRLKDHGAAQLFGGGDIGAHVFPAKRDQPAHGKAVAQGRLQNVRERGERHLNLAIMSLMPGIVSIW